MSTSNITGGVMKNEIRNVPKKPMRRWLPAKPVRRQKTKYMSTPMVNSMM